MLTDINQIDQGISILKEVLAKEKVNYEAWNYLGVAYFKKGWHTKAIEAYNKAVALHKGYDSAYNNLGTLYLTLFLRNKDQNHHRQAIKYLKKALQYNPKLASAHNGLGAAYKFVGQNDKAITAWTRALEVQPGFIDVYFNLSILLIETGQKEKALHYLNICKEKFSAKLDQPAKKRLMRLIGEAKN